MTASAIGSAALPSLQPTEAEPTEAPSADLVSPAYLAAAIRSGRWPSDIDFDRSMARELRSASNRYWSQLAVAERAACWFDELGVECVVDIGSGVGKFCVASALAGSCRFIGLEQRPRLVSEARKLAAAFGVDDRVQFVNARFGDVGAPRADVYYLYNPFGENLFGHRDHLDADVELSSRRYLQDIESVENMLRDAPVGTHLLTYNGFGGRVPASYAPTLIDRTLPSTLRMWRKVTLVEHGRGTYAGVD